MYFENKPLSIRTLLARQLASVPLSQSELDFLSSKAEFLHLKKNQPFVEEDKICQKMGILLDGLMVAYYGIEKEIASRFFYLPKNPLVTCFESFKNEIPSKETIIAIEDSYLFCFSRKTLEELYSSVPNMNLIGRKLAENSYIHALNRIHNLQTFTNKEKLEAFLSECPGLYNRVPKKYIASYLGMHRNEISKYMKGR